MIFPVDHLHLVPVENIPTPLWNLRHQSTHTQILRSINSWCLETLHECTLCCGNLTFYYIVLVIILYILICWIQVILQKWVVCPIVQVEQFIFLQSPAEMSGHLNTALLLLDKPVTSSADISKAVSSK